MDAVQFKPPAHKDVPVLALSESGSSMMLWSLVAGISYDRKDSEALADHLEAAATMVRKYA